MDDADYEDAFRSNKFEMRMSAVGYSISFRWGRGLLAALVTAALGLAAVELLSPERHVGNGTVAAEVAVRIVPRLAPSADAIRRSVITTESLREVAARLRGETAANQADDAATFERWRRQLAVEILPTGDPQRRRIRFVALTGGRPEEAAALADTIAVRYAESLTAERWYAAVDRLRTAETAADAIFERLLDLLRNSRTAGTARQAPIAAAAAAAPRDLPSLAATPLAASQSELERELFQLIRQRAVLLETLQPAHPQITALDARLNSLQLAGASTHVRRLSGEEEVDLTLPGFDDPPSTAAPTEAVPTLAPPRTAQVKPPSTSGLPPAAVDAVEQWQQSRVGVKVALEQMLEPAAAEFPVVSTTATGLRIWEHRDFWRLSAGALALLVGIALALPRLIKATTSSVPTASPPAAVAPVFESERKPPAAVIATVTPQTAAEPIVPGPVAPQPIAATAPAFAEPPASVPAAVIETVEQASSAAGAPVLGVLLRRREPASTVA